MSVELQLLATLPVLAPLVAALVVLLLDAAVPHQREPHLLAAAAGLVAGAAGAVPGLRLGAGDVRGAFCLPSGECLYAATRLVSVLQLTALLAALVVLVLAWRDWSAPGPGGGREQTGRAPVVAALALGATGGVAAVPAAGDLGTLLVSLELATLPTVALVVLVRTTWAAPRRARAVEGAVSLLTISLVSFSLLALGAGLWVAATGSALLGRAGTSVEHPALLVLAAVFLVAGLAFKVSAVPFHAWTPITYAAAPLPVTAYLATVSKVAALGGLVVVVQALGVVDDTTLVAVAVLAAASMTLGNLVALTQTDTVRLLAWSTVAQAGWVLLPLASLSSRAAHAATSYLVVYVTATLLAFVVVIAVARTSEDPGGRRPLTSLAAHQGMLRTRPALALALTLALLTLAGLPPAVVGVVAKIVALRPVLGDQTWWLAVVASLNIALGLAVYLRWLVVVVGPSRAAPRQAAGDGADDTEGAERDEARTPVRIWVLLTVLTLLLVGGSIMPVGIA